MSSFFLMSLIVLFMCLSAINAGKGKIYYDEVERQKQYEEEEKGKVAPMRTFLTTWEIALICIFSIIGLFLLIGLLFYLCRYGCVLPRCCKRKEKYISETQLQREKKIGEIWQTRYQPVRA